MFVWACLRTMTNVVMDQIELTILSFYLLVLILQGLICNVAFIDLLIVLLMSLYGSQGRSDGLPCVSWSAPLLKSERY